MIRRVFSILCYVYFNVGIIVVLYDKNELPYFIGNICCRSCIIAMVSCRMVLVELNKFG